MRAWYRTMPHNIGPVVYCIHRDGCWVRTKGGEGGGYVVLGPRHRPLFSERHGHGGRVIWSWHGWRIRKMEPRKVKRQWIDPNAPEWICEKCGAVVNASLGGFNSCGCKAGIIVVDFEETRTP